SVSRAALPAEVSRREFSGIRRSASVRSSSAEPSTASADRPRWVWDDTTTWYPPLLSAGVRVERCVDLRLSHAILRGSELTAETAFARAAHGDWDEPAPEHGMPAREGHRVVSEGLFELEPESAPGHARSP